MHRVPLFYCSNCSSVPELKCFLRQQVRGFAVEEFSSAVEEISQPVEEFSGAVEQFSQSFPRLPVEEFS